jgi:hypothetical protein
MMTIRAQITLDPELQRRAHAKAAELGISFAEYVRRLLTDDLGPQKPKVDISMVFNLIDEGRETNIASDKDKMIGEDNYLRKMGRKAWRSARPKKGRR